MHIRQLPFCMTFQYRVLGSVSVSLGNSTLKVTKKNSTNRMTGYDIMRSVKVATRGTAPCVITTCGRPEMNESLSLWTEHQELML
jgi:hypothetical protein